MSEGMPRILTAGSCPATREAVEEREEEGDTGCPLCGLASSWHRPEDDEEPS